MPTKSRRPRVAAPKPKSKRPAPKPAQAPAAPRDEALPADPSAWTATLAAAFASHAPRYPISAALTQYFHDLTDDAHARRLGAQHGADEVLSDLVRMLPRAAQHAAHGWRITGYGPVRLTYALGLAVAFATEYSARNDAVRAKLGKHEVKLDALSQVRHTRTELVTILTNVLGHNHGAERVQIEKAGALASQTHEDSLRVLANLVHEARALVAHHPEDATLRLAARDGGLTDALLAEASAQLAAAESASAAHAADTSDLLTAAGGFQAAMGRLRGELSALASAYHVAKRTVLALPDLALHHTHRTTAIGAPDAPTGGATTTPGTPAP